MAAKLLLTSLLIAVIGSCSSAAAQVRQVLCGDQGATLDPQLWQSDPRWFLTWERTQALHGSAPGLQESPGYRKPSRVLYIQMNGWMNSGMNEWKISKPIWSPKCWNCVCPWMTIWQWTWIPVTRKSERWACWPHTLLQLLPCLCFCPICKDACRWVHITFFLSPAPSLCNIFWVRLLNWVSLL